MRSSSRGLISHILGYLISSICILNWCLGMDKDLSFYPIGFEGHGFQGKVYGPSAEHNPHSSEWLSMRPLVQCNDNLMMLTASGRGYTHLLVDRGKRWRPTQYF